jgi:DNA-binding transcriptional regulator YiaG
VGKIEMALKAEIARLSRRETRALVARPIVELRSLRARVGALERELRALRSACAGEQAKAKARSAAEAVTAEKAAKARLSPKLLKKLRGRLKVSQGELAKLVGVTTAAVGFWESGKSQPKPETKARIVALRRLGRREVRRLLAEQEA